MNVKLLTLLALGLSIPNAIQAQDSEELGQALRGVRNGVDEEVTDLYKKNVATYKTKHGEEFEYNTFTSGSTDVHKFNNDARVFRDWAISVGGGVNFMTRGDLTSFHHSHWTPGYNVYVSLDKQLTHTFGLSLQYQFGRSNQRATLASLTEDVIYPVNEGTEKYNGYVAYKTGYANGRGLAKANTKYHQISILGDLNLSNLFRRMDNFSPYRWALHAYVGLGVQGFKTYREDEHPRGGGYAIYENKQDLGIASFFYQGGLGLKYKLSRLIDIEARVMYVISGDDEFDGGGWTPEEWPGYNMIKKNDSDNMMTANLGLTFKLGKKGATHLAWYDPLTELYYRSQLLGEPRTTVCENGDNDNDGVCDDWDRQLDTPAGARVDGAGVALDLDMDGVIDLYDKCVTVPGPVSNLGCPEEQGEGLLVDELDRIFEGVVFDLDKYTKVTSSSTGRLEEASKVIGSLNPIPELKVIGATDARGSVQYNQTLSEKRANTVVNYLETKGGIPKGKLFPEGRGKKDLKYPECDPASKCPEWKNEANRRVYFELKK